MPFKSVSGSIESARRLSTAGLETLVALATAVAAASAIDARAANTVAAEATPRVKLRPPRPLVQTPPTRSSAVTSTRCETVCLVTSSRIPTATVSPGSNAERNVPAVVDYHPAEPLALEEIRGGIRDGTGYRCHRSQVRVAHQASGLPHDKSEPAQSLRLRRERRSLQEPLVFGYLPKKTDRSAGSLLTELRPPNSGPGSVNEHPHRAAFHQDRVIT